MARNKKPGSGSRPIEAVGTAVAAFVGVAKQHPALTVAAVLALLVLVRVARAGSTGTTV
ncbi:hypothetical protein ATJ97_0679 [Georgenia soli]|uniref:Uncharacterized protein n=1 Tax=Georgenia soli TaxID=638953 RepID=A0A2A9EGL1_9MICO|nr:hypothetical protein [Georgenia soli]PFG38207.1 hypothetical protein ATJ97_0679 [Georgenia soli]